MKLRTVEVIVTLALGILLVPLLAEAQQAKKMPRIGYLSLTSGPTEVATAFMRGLEEIGWVESQNIVIEWRWAAGKPERLSELAADLVRLNVDVIVALSTPVAHAAKNATSTIPIVVNAADPVGTGLVASLARPGGNITGTSLILPELAGKRLELLLEVIPRLDRVAFLAHGGDPAHRLFVKEAQDAAGRFRMLLQPLVVKGPEEFEHAFSVMVRERAGALVVQPLFITVPEQRSRLVELSTKNRLPAITDFAEFPDSGGLISYGPNRLDNHRRLAVYVDKILKGAKPADLPVEQPMKFELVINLKAAKQIGLTIPPWVLMRADKVIK